MLYTSSLCLCLSKIAFILKVCLHSLCQTPDSAGIYTTGSSEISSPVASPGTICIIPHSAWQGAHCSFPMNPYSRFWEVSPVQLICLCP